MKLKHLGFAFLGVMLWVGLSAAQSSSVVEFPPLSGEYAVGMRVLALTDSQREERFTADPNDPREVLVHLYYPAQATGDPAPYVAEADLAVVAQATGMPAALFQQVHSHHYADAPILVDAAPYPVLLFSPGMGMLPLFYRAWLEDLASQGYVVAALHHSYSSMFSIFPDGRVLLANELGYARLDAAGSQAEAECVAVDIGVDWLEDMQLVLDELARLNADDSTWAGMLDLERVGAFGHSFGGQNSLAFSVVDERVDAAVNLDGSMFGDVREQQARVPALIWHSEAPNPTDEELAAANITREELATNLTAQQAPVYHFISAHEASLFLSLAGSAHNTFVSDWVLIGDTMPQLLPESLVGRIDGADAYALVRDTLSSFFAAYVKGEGAFRLPYDPRLLRH